MKVFTFQLMPYADIDRQSIKKGAWITVPSSHFDPEKGRALYDRYMDELELAADLGFDGISVNEHHQTPYGMMPSPIVIASALARRTRNCKIAILGSAFCLREHPLTLAEEHAMLDCITGGRIISGFVRGVGAEYYSFGVDPTVSHERHMEAHDLVIQAWTKPGPFAFEGKHYHFEYVNLWPRPFQKPHPPVWIPSQGSNETIEWAAHPSRKYLYMQNFNPWKAAVQYLNSYREVAEKRYGYVASSEQLGWAAPCYVAETDGQAVAEAREHIEFLFNDLLNMPRFMFFPPGYTSRASMRRVVAAKQSIMGGRRTVEALIEHGVIICGSPDTVRSRIIDCHRQLGFSHFMILPQFGTLPHDLTVKNLRLFAKEVLPAIQPLGDRDYRGFDINRVAAE
jgi:alkanesulfonate monooxygenase SsuD/methylene tetrahydromethanopterin reductase-like flavin-dependent oxidoreductase (luciferase family)